MLTFSVMPLEPGILSRGTRSGIMVRMRSIDVSTGETLLRAMFSYASALTVLAHVAHLRTIRLIFFYSSENNSPKEIPKIF